MSYITGGIIQATDYNTFATLATAINEVFADDHSGAVRNAGLYPVLTNDPVTYGYGQTALTSVTAGTPVLATQWANLFQTFARTGQHQNTTVVPPLPGTAPGFGAGSTTLPAVGNSIIAYSGVATLLNTLRANRLLLSTDVTQYSFTAGTAYASSSPWTNTLTYSTQVNFGSWNNARYFFNSGGFLGINGSWTGASTPIELAFRDVLLNMSPLRFNYLESTASVGTGATAVGFYDLTTSYQTIFYKEVGSMYYMSSYVRVEARLNAAAGTNGLVDFRITLQDDDTFPDTKTSPVSFSVSNTRSIGGVVYPGVVTVTSGGFTYA